MHHNGRLISWWRPLPVFPPVSSSTGPVWVSRFSLILPQSPSITPWLHHDSLLCCKYTTLKMFLSCRWSSLNEPRMRNWQIENWYSNSECCASLDLTCDSDLHQLWGCLWSPLYHSAQNKTWGQRLLLLCCFSIRILSDLSCLQSLGQLVSSKLCLNTLWSSKIYSSYALFLLCFSFYSHWLQFHTAVFIFCSRVQRREKCLGCVIVCMVTFKSWVMTRSN